MPDSRSSWLPFKRLHGLQAVTTLIHAVRPPRDFGTTWSKVSSLVAKSPPQYWQWKRSRRNTLNRVKAGRRAAGTYSLSAMTLGSRISQEGLWILRSYSEITLTRSRNTALTASCQDQIDNGKYDRGRKSALSTSAWQDSRPGVTASLAAVERDYCGSPIRRKPGRTCRALWQFFPKTQHVDSRFIDLPLNDNIVDTGGNLIVDTVTNFARKLQVFRCPGRSRIAGLPQRQIDRLIALIERHIAENRYPGCQIALARHGKLALYRSFGNAVTDPKPRAAADDTLWLLYSNTKVVTAVALWALAERGLFSFSDKIADHVPAFAKNAKGNITVLQTITHQAGFPNAVVGKDAWADHKRLREVVCDFPLEWTPGSKVHYHGLRPTGRWAC